VAVISVAVEGKGLPRGRRLADLAARQHGVVSIRQLRVLGFSDGAVAAAVRAGRLHRLHQGAYAVGHTDLSPRGRCLAAVLGCGADALLSHWSAAWVWDLVPSGPVPIHVTTPIPRRPRPGLLIHRSRTLVDEDRELRDGIPVTAVPRTVLDLAPRVRRGRVDRLLQRTEELRLFELADFRSVIDRNRGHRGYGRLRRALALYQPPPFTRSGLEDRFLELVSDSWLPRPVTAYVEAGYELDVYWPDLRFAVELDVFETHGTRLSFERDRVRQEDLKLAGVELVRITGPRLSREPDAVLKRLERLLAMRRAELAG
jgi:hypothetical protein